jgi:hypothetical protein
LRNPYRNVKSENSQDYVQKPQRNFMNSDSGYTAHLYNKEAIGVFASILLSL